MSFVKLTASTLAIAAVSATAAAARDQVQVAGSSTVLPYASIVAEAFGENFDFPTPVVESGGSSAGLKRFCEGVGENTIDVANASRAIKEKEIKAVHESGHALVALLMPHTDPVHKISIIPRGMGVGGYTLQMPLEDKNLISKTDGG